MDNEETDDESRKAQNYMRRMGDQGYRMMIETTDHIGSTTWAGHNQHLAEITVGLDDTPGLVHKLDELLDQIRGDHQVSQYGCFDCESPFRMKKDPQNCPFCGSQDIKEYEKWLDQ